MKFLSKKNLQLFSIFMIVIFAILFFDFGCVIRYAFGFPCPSCGLTRAYKCFFAFKFKEAFFWHPLFLYIPLLFFVYCFKRWEYELKEVKWFKIFLVISLIVLGIVFVVRMICFFPNTQPMTYNHNSLIQRVISFFVNFCK